ncbi:MAG: peptidylprolyl isomerase [Rhodospirillales bacterium]
MSRTFILRIIIILALALNVHAASTAPANAQATLNIAAVVNEDVISVYDLSQRILMVIALSNLPNNAETHQEIAPDILRRLILEKLRLQEAKRLEIEVPEEAIKISIANLERQNKLPAGGMDQFLSSRGIDPETLKQQLNAELAWIDVVRALFRRLVTVSEQEVDDVIAKMKADTGKTEYLVAEIFLAYDEKPRSEVEQIARRIHAELGAGASWQQMAQNFSESASASGAGDLGWGLATDFDPVIGSVLTRLQPGQISSPVATDDGVYIVFLRERRIAKGLEITPEDITLGIQQLHLDVAQNADAQTVTRLTEQARQLASSADTCQAFESIAKSEGSPSSGFLGNLKLSQLNPQLRTMVQSLRVGETSQPFRTADGVIVLMVCTREQQGQKDPLAEARSDIENRILNQRLSRMAAQHEEKLRRQAFIDIRL